MRSRPGGDAQPEHLHRAHHAPGWSSARWATRGRSAPCSAASRCTRRTTARSTRTYRLAIRTSRPGGRASFRQFDLLTALDVSVPPRSTVARTVFARSSDPHARHRSRSAYAGHAPAARTCRTDSTGTIILNPDPTNPDIENPGHREPGHREPRHRELRGSQPRHRERDHAKSGHREPGHRESRTSRTRHRERPRREPRHHQPGIENPDIENPDIENPDIENPDIENADLVNGALSDTTWIVRNKGNNAAAFTINLALNRAAAARIQEPADRAQGVQDADCARLLAAETAADGAVGERAEPPVRGGQRNREPGHRKPRHRERHDRPGAGRDPRASRCACSIRTAQTR